MTGINVDVVRNGGVRRIQAAAAFLAALLVISLAGPVDAARAAVGSARIDLRVLVFNDNSPGVAALVAAMDREGVPYTSMSATTPISTALLENTGSATPHAKYQAIVVPNSNPTSSGISASEMNTLAAYERKFGVRQVNAYLFPDSVSDGMTNQWTGTIDGMTASLTAAALTGPFSYLKGPVAIDDVDPAVSESTGNLAAPVSPQPTGQSVVPMLTLSVPGAAGSLVAVQTDNGREEMLITGAFNGNQQWFQTIAHGIITWATRGVHLGYNRNYLSVHIDDVFLPDSRWSSTAHCTPGDDFCPEGVTTPDIRMTADDVTRLLNWQAASNFKLDMAFNGNGSELYESENGPDPLLAAFAAGDTETKFDWINHTYTHAFLGCLQIAPTAPGQTWSCATSGSSTQWVSQATITSEIRNNLTWAAANGLGPVVKASELVTGEHSGLRVTPQQTADNPNFVQVAAAQGIAFTASDNSREPTQRSLSATTRTVPRHPMNIFYNAGAFQDEVDEYNWIYTAAPGGSGICSANPATSTCITPLDASTNAAAQASFLSYIKPIEERIALSHVMTNDPRPHYAHQSNIAEDGILYPVLDGVLDHYRTAFADNAPIVKPTITESGQVLAQAATWRSLTNSVTAYLDGTGVHVTGPAGTQVPVTVPNGSTGPSLSGYANELSGWSSAPASFVVPDVGYGSAPSAPANVAGVAGDTLVKLSWTAATVAPGAAPITSYLITPYVAGVARPVIATNSNATTFDVTGLTNGTAYTFTVAARSAVADGPASLASAPVTPLGMPAAPTGVAATRGNRQVTLTWAAPADNGGAPVTSYVITPKSGTTSLAAIETGNAATSRTVTGLTNGLSYTFTVQARTSVGLSPASAPSAAVIPAAVPGAPTGVAVVAGNRAATVKWNAPASDGASPVTAYVVRQVGGTITRTLPASARTVVITGLTNGRAYRFTVAARNAVGETVSAPSASAVPSGPPRVAMRALSSAVTPVTKSSRVTFSWVGTPDGSPILRYDVWIRRAAYGKPLSGWQRYTYTRNPYTTVSLSAGQTVVVAVQAVDYQWHRSALSAPSRSVTRPLGVTSVAKSRGWAYRSSAAYYGRTAAQSTTRGATVASPTAYGVRRVSFIASTGRGFGSVDVIVGGKLVRTISLSSTRPAASKVLYTPVFAPRSGKVVLRVRTSGRLVRIQGLAVFR